MYGILSVNLIKSASYSVAQMIKSNRKLVQINFIKKHQLIFWKKGDDGKRKPMSFLFFNNIYTDTCKEKPELFYPAKMNEMEGKDLKLDIF